MKNGTVLVTGGSRGIGRAIVARLIEDGYEAVNFSRGAPESLLPGETFRSVDLADARAAGEPRANWPRRAVLHLVNNAGMIEVAGIEAVTQDALARPSTSWRPSCCCRRCCRACARPATDEWSTSAAALGKPGRTAYGASKGALAAMTRTWALELAADGITVNTVAPGAGGDGTVQRVESPAIRARARWRPRSRWAGSLPEEVAHVVAMFMDRRAAFVRPGS